MGGIWHGLAHSEEAEVRETRPLGILVVFPVGLANDPFKKDGSSSTDGGAMYQSPCPARTAVKRILGVEGCQVRNWDDACLRVDGGKAEGIDVVRDDGIDQICSTKNLDQVHDCVPLHARKAAFEHGGELLNGLLGNLDARLWTVCFRDFAG